VVNNTLQCYQCEIRGTDEASCDKKLDLKQCPSIQAYDRCLTNFRKNASIMFPMGAIEASSPNTLNCNEISLRYAPESFLSAM
ncbi:unnamed protein product, partial [Allacma fusca]